MKYLSALIFLCCTLPAGASEVLHCGHLLDVENGTLIENAEIVIDGGRILQAGPAGSVSAPAASVKIDLAGAFCLPGLIDVHTHLTADPTGAGYKSLGISVPRSTVTGVKNARATLMAGFTTVRNLGARGYSDVALRDGIEAGDVLGPRLQVSGPALGITGGHCDENLLAPEFHHFSEGVADGPWAVRAKVREVVKYGADVVKICASGGVLSKGDQPGTEQYTLEEMQAIVEEAHKLGRKVASHAHGARAIVDSIRAGVDSVEHCSLIDDEGLRLAKERGAFLVFDIYNDDYIVKTGASVGMLPESIEKEKKIGAVQRENFRRAVLAGARMAFGTDGGVYPHGENARQFAYMVKYGMTALDAIRAATVNAAQLMGWADRVGALKPGMFADVIAIDGNPLADVSALERVKFVMKGGRVVREWAK